MKMNYLPMKFLSYSMILGIQGARMSLSRVVNQRCGLILICW